MVLPPAVLQNLHKLEFLNLKGEVWEFWEGEACAHDLQVLPPSLTKLQLQRCESQAGATDVEQLMHLVSSQDSKSLVCHMRLDMSQESCHCQPDWA